MDSASLAQTIADALKARDDVADASVTTTDGGNGVEVRSQGNVVYRVIVETPDPTP